MVFIVSLCEPGHEVADRLDVPDPGPGGGVLPVGGHGQDGVEAAAVWDEDICWPPVLTWSSLWGRTTTRWRRGGSSRGRTTSGPRRMGSHGGGGSPRGVIGGE